ncbi:MAG: tRNA (adenosine(37)-N6)-dimethylallyltransferase MiaA [Polyangiaceae bacterium]|jgi:tRNA dimethylallyltransferase|nr:tRNA (adenosine(37)-N6)-dimethylallyltransferase MiaA [Polyangiaceae bacterium]
MKLRSVPLEFDPDELLCVVGTTASQKTELAIRICEEVGGEVVGADSVQIYTHFDIGSGKPTQQELQRARHHLVGTTDPLATADAARFALMANEAIADIRSRGKIPVVCGGTFFWVRALVMGLASAPAADQGVRLRLTGEAERHGVAALHARLQLVDPRTAARLAPNDFVRVQRALEVYELAGKRLSDLHEEHQMMPPRHRARYVGIHWDRSVLEARMRMRAQAWLNQGWIEEVEALLGMGMRRTRAMGSVGYRQVVSYLEGQLPGPRLLDEIVRATKIYARRQRTWLREVGVTWLEPL